MPRHRACSNAIMFTDDLFFSTIFDKGYSMSGAMILRHLLILLLAAGVTAACSGEDVQPEAPGNPVPGEQTRDLNPEIDEAVFNDFSAHNRDFAFDFFAHLLAHEEDENLLVSPHSITSALAMTYAGAREETRDEMAQALHYHLDESMLFPAFNSLDLALQDRSQVEVDGDPPTLRVANQAWGHEDLDFVQDYLNVLSQHFGSDMRTFDFATEYEEARAEINEWVEASTEDRITNPLPAGSLNPATRFVLVNALYFYADWRDEFKESETQDETFYGLDGDETQVPLMRKTRTMRYANDGDTKMVSIPYMGGELALVAWLPVDESDDFRQWEQSFDRPAFDALMAEFGSQRVRLFLPRFRQEQQFPLSEIFEQMGMTKAFTETANFEGIAHPPGGAELLISEIFHQTFIVVNEEGTEAAAATAVVGSAADSEPPQPVVVRLDRPFYYAIYDHPTDTILFMGRMANP